MLLAVTGRPIAHSASPELHRAGMKALGIKGASIRLIADSAQEALTLSRELGVSGLNVTAPFKEEISNYLDSSSPETKELGAVNTILFSANKLSGFNTDTYGVTESLRPFINLLGSDAKAVILGAGGAAKATAKALSVLGLSFSVVNRGLARAKELASYYHSASFEFADIESEKAITEAAIIINCLSCLTRPFRDNLLNSKQIVLDSHYKQESEITKEAKSIGATVISGLDWLIHQSRESQRIFFGAAPAFDALKAAVHEKKSKKSIALIGLMGAGKSMVAQGLATELGWNLVDLDQQIEAGRAKSISEIFAEDGEANFRNIESSELFSLKQNNAHVLSCGGGIILDARNRNYLQDNYRVIWLWADTTTLSSRLAQQNSRPLLQNTNIEERLQQLLIQRKDLYAEVADLVIGTAERSQREVIERIYEEIC